MWDTLMPKKASGVVCIAVFATLLSVTDAADVAVTVVTTDKEVAASIQVGTVIV